MVQRDGILAEKCLSRPDLFLNARFHNFRYAIEISKLGFVGKTHPVLLAKHGLIYACNYST